MSYPSGDATLIAHASLGVRPDPRNSERCGRRHVRPDRRLKPTRAEFDDAAQLAQVEPMQKLIVDVFQ